ncbi:hypothetical protein KW795_02455 [Candidatus Microgenomates bacterium]|nr:hypothetical protein [Candidatus Microgenomates bacterium]
MTEKDNELALPSDISVSEARDSIEKFVWFGITSELVPVLRQCKTDKQRVSIFKNALKSLDIATPTLLSQKVFSARLNKLLVLDESPTDDGFRRGFVMIKKAITELAENNSDEGNEEEIAVFDDEDDLDIQAQSQTGLGTAIRLCRKISTSTMLTKLGLIDVELELCDAGRMADYVRAMCYDIYRAKKAIKFHTGWGEIIEVVTVLEDLLTKIIERNENDLGFFDKVVGSLRDKGHGQYRNDLSYSYIQDSIRIVAEISDTVAPEFLMLMWLDEDGYRNPDNL